MLFSLQHQSKCQFRDALKDCRRAETKLVTYGLINDVELYMMVVNNEVCFSLRQMSSSHLLTIL